MSVRTSIPSRRTGLPAWALGLIVFVFLVGGVYAASNLAGENPQLVGPLPTGSAVASGGGGGAGAAMAIIERAGCQACHGQDLTGSGAFPSLHGLAGGPTVENLQELGTAEPDSWMHIWIAGTDERVSDPAFRMGMPAFGGTLTDAEIDTIVEYLKTLQ